MTSERCRDYSRLNTVSFVNQMSIRISQFVDIYIVGEVNTLPPCAHQLISPTGTPQHPKLEAYMGFVLT